MRNDPCSRQTEPAIHTNEATEPRMVKVVQHHAYRSRPEREFFFIGGHNDLAAIDQQVQAA